MTKIATITVEVNGQRLIFTLPKKQTYKFLDKVRKEYCSKNNDSKSALIIANFQLDNFECEEMVVE